MRKTLVLGISTSFLALTVPAYAHGMDDATQSPSAATDEIVVTAQRRAESINDVPLVVQAFNADTLETLKIDDVKALASAVPGLTVSPAYSGVPIFTLRGIGFNSVNVTATSTVGIYQDELAYPYPSMANGPIYDLERVEVLKGPQGTLYGRNTTAGLIGFVTRKPKLGEMGFNGAVEIGSYETYNFEAGANLPLGDDAAIRIAIRSENSDQGWQVDPTRGERLGEKDKLAGRFSLLWEPSKQFEVFASVSAWRDRSDTQAGQAISLNLTNRLSAASATPGPGHFNLPGVLNYLSTYQPTDAKLAAWAPAAQRAATLGLAPGMGEPRADTQFFSAQLRLTGEISDKLTLISMTGYNKFKRGDVADFSGVPYEIVSTEYDSRIESVSQELRLQGEAPGVRWSIGGYYAHDDLQENSRFLIGENSSVAYLRLSTLGILADPALNALFNVEGHTPADVTNAFREGASVASGKAETVSVFANAEIELSPQFTVSAGLRYGSDTTQLAACSIDYNGNYLPIVNTAGRAIIFASHGQIAPLVTKNGCTTYDPVTNTDLLVDTELKEDNLSGRLSFQYKPVADTMIFASIARGVKSGNIPIVPANRKVQFTPAKQEQLTAYEVGIKAGVADRLAQINVTGFYYDYTDKQFSSYVPDPTFGALQRLVNIPNSHAWGIDAEVLLRPSRELSLVWNATYLKTKVEDYVGANAAGIATDYSGAGFSYAPEFATGATLNFNTPLTSNFNLQATLNGSYQSKSHSDFGEDPLFEIKGYALLNASIGIESANGGWGLSLWARNLTDTYYWSSVADNQNLNVRFAGMPRTYGATLSFNF